MTRALRLRFGVAVFCLGMLDLHFAFFWMARKYAFSGSPDFKIFYAAALMLKRGQGDMLYSDSLQEKTEEELAPEVVRNHGALPYNHPPFEAALFVPLTYLSFLRAYLAWTLLNLLFLAVSLFLIYPWVPRIRSLFPVTWYIAPLAFFPIAYAFMQGQDSVLLLFLYCLAYVALRKQQDLRAGIFLGLGLFKFHLVLPFVFLLLVARRWRTIAGFLISAMFDFVVSWLLVGWKELIKYPGYTLHIDRLQPFRVIVPRNMPNIRGLLTGWGSAPHPPVWLEVILVVVSLFVLGWASRQWRPGDLRDEGTWNRGFSIAMISTFLVGYHGYNQDMSMLLLPVLLIIEHTLSAARNATALKILAGIMFFTPLYLLLTFHVSHQNLFCIVLLCLAVLLAVSGDTEQRPASSGRGTELLTAQHQ
ncbi:MAG TPA: glycosyltransferase family 87 protein [Candidatus Sulfotelmatobacter sp.]|nr:glycosyltransferase family 87 protein [Candidatus Sulfotelmatobacter sp.]